MKNKKEKFKKKLSFLPIIPPLIIIVFFLYQHFVHILILFVVYFFFFPLFFNKKYIYTFIDLEVKNSIRYQTMPWQPKQREWCKSKSFP